MNLLALAFVAAIPCLAQNLPGPPCLAGSHSFGGIHKLEPQVGCLEPTPATVWSGYGHDARHTALSDHAAQALKSIHWQTPVDLGTPASGSIFVHYGSPAVTAANTVIVPVRTSTGSFEIRAFSGATGAALYTLATDYAPPSHDWTPPYAPVLAQGTKLFYPGAGGTVFWRDQADSTTGTTGRIAFYGNAAYEENPAVYNSAVEISTPLTADAAGNIYFGFTVSGANPAGLQSGIARIAVNGTGIWVSALSLSGDSNASQIALNCAPAISNDQQTVYIATTNGNEYGNGYLTSLSAATLAPLSHVYLYDPQTGNPATILSDSSAAPAIGPDGDLYYGVLESPCCGHNDRGWLLHFNSTLTVSKIPGSFGWDDTPSILPASLVPSYTGTSTYLLLSKYNNYANIGTGTGINKIAILDPFATQLDEYATTSVTVMKEVITVTGPTHNPGLNQPPNAVYEWCINTAAVDPFTAAAIINSEDGTVYRWDFASNSLLQRVSLTPGRSEAYTSTVIGADGTVLAINDGILFAVGN
jgi:hypothetical protein